MKKLLLASLITSVLTGCNGSSESSSVSKETPVVHDIPTLSTEVGGFNGTFTYRIEATDPNGDTLSFALEGNPEWITVESTTGVISVGLDQAIEGEYTFTVLISDGTNIVKRVIKLNITLFTADPDNGSPAITAIPPINARTNYVSTFSVEATDTEQDILSYSLSNQPDWISIHPETGVVSINAKSGHQGDYAFTVKVADGNTQVATPVSLIVEYASDPDFPELDNNTPLVDAIPMILAKAGQTASHRIFARDIDNDTLTYSLHSAPSWVSVDPHSGLIQINADKTHLGDHAFNAIVTDGIVDVIRSFQVRVELPIIESGNTPPTVTRIPSLTMKTEQEATYRIKAYDIDNDVLSYSLANHPEWISIEPKSGLITATPSVWNTGTYTFSVTVADGESETVSSMTVIVEAADVAKDPVIQAILTGDHTLVTEQQLLDFAVKEINQKTADDQAIIDQLYTGITGINWVPTHDAMFVSNYNSTNGNIPILTTNVDDSGNAINIPIGLTGKKVGGQRYAIFGGNPLGVWGNDDLHLFMKNVFAWISGGEKENLTVVVANVPNAGYFPHYDTMEAWFNNQYPNAHTINSYKQCDYENLETCVKEMKPDVVLLGSDDYEGKGYDGIKSAMAYMEKNRIPLVVTPYGRDMNALLTPVFESNGISFASNYWSRYVIESGDRSDVTLKPDVRLDVINKFKNQDFDINAANSCTTTYLHCNTGAFMSEFRTSADAFQGPVIRYDVAGIDVFDEKEEELTKVSLLLADKYRSEIDYPISQSDPVQWYKAIFADWLVSYARDDNKAQSDLGEYIVDTRDVVTGDDAHYTYPETVTDTKTISVPYSNQWTTTGWYALPGKPVTLTRHGEDDHEIIVQLYYGRSNTNRVYETKVYRKPVDLTTARIRVPAKGSVTFSTPYGAPIYLNMRHSENKPLSSSITATGIAEHPSITDFSDPQQVVRFETLLNNTELPHVDLKSLGAEQHLRRDKFNLGMTEQYPTPSALLKAVKEEHLETVYSLAAFKVQGKTLDESVSADAMAVCKAKFGADCVDENLHTRKIIQHANYDQDAQCGIGCAGNPWDSTYPITPRGWLDNHELGHNLQTGRLRVGYTTEDGRNTWANYHDRAGENSNNIFPYYVIWKGHNVTDGSTAVIEDGHMNSKDAFFAIQSDAAGVTDANGNRVVLGAWCGSVGTGSTRHDAIWSSGDYAANNSIRMSFYIQMALNAHGKVLSDGTTLTNGFDIFTALYLHERIYGTALADSATWLANRDRLGFSAFDFDTPHGNVSRISGNDFMLVSLSYLTGLDWTPYFDMYGLRNTDLAKQQAGIHGTKGAIATGMYVLDRDLPPLNMSEGVDFLPINMSNAETVWPRDESSPVGCGK
ncbi:ImpA family metalloprotease [Photobacterium japonica]|uniref:ImpA family metalloprotease n=1 Tax=Photobacterium japonica TaxID=2910235 RepID=UPI003D0E3E70